MIHINRSVLIRLLEKYKDEISPEERSSLEKLLKHEGYTGANGDMMFKGGIIERTIHNLLNLDLTSEV